MTACTFNEENLTEMFLKTNWNFEAFEKIEKVTLKKKDVLSDWSIFTNQVALILSPSFSKLVVETEKLSQSQLQQLCVAL